MKFNVPIIFASSLLLASCVSITTSDEYNPSVVQLVTNVPAPNYRPAYYRAPDGTTYRENDLYRDRLGIIYKNGSKIGEDNVFEHAGIIGNVSDGKIKNSGTLPPVDFDSEEYGSQIPKHQDVKRSGANGKPNYNRAPRNGNTY